MSLISLFQLIETTVSEQIFQFELDLQKKTDYKPLWQVILVFVYSGYF